MKDIQLRQALEQLDIILSASRPTLISEWRKDRFRAIDQQLGRADRKLDALLAHLGLKCKESGLVIEKIGKEAK